MESTYAAEYGRNAGGIVSVVSKSGTNQLHGTIYDYVRNTNFDANDFFNNQQGLPRAVLKRNQYGGTFGGPTGIATSFLLLLVSGPEANPSAARGEGK